MTSENQAPKRKLIEVALPLEVINRESAREKSIRHGHPSTLHLWWARRPLAAARAILFAQLVDDPSSHPEEFPTDELQRKERERLHKLIERLAVWENARDERLLAEAHAEILKSTDGNPPPILDPFAGGGTIPLEAKRLGLSALANDLNPLPVLINTVLLELVDRFDVRAPISGGLPRPVPESLAEDLRLYAGLLETRVKARVSHLYPAMPNGSEPLVYFWARTVRCPNPACNAEVPLVGSWKLSDRKGSETRLVPRYIDDERAFDVDVISDLKANADGTMIRTGATCPRCDAGIKLDYIKKQGVAGHMASRLLALQVRRNKVRSFVAADNLQRAAADAAPEVEASFLDSELSTHSQYMAPPRYGLSRFHDLFSPRQLATLVAFVDALDEVQDQIREEAVLAGLPDDGIKYSNLGQGAQAYSDAIRILLALGIAKLVNRQSTLCIWHPGRHTVEQVFARQAYSMTWLYAESNPFAGASGSFSGQIDYLAKSVAATPTGKGSVTQGPAQKLVASRGVVVSTDPPYYDNVPYADLSDFFLVWHRRMLRETLPIFPTVLAPKSEELVADHVRWGSKQAAKEFFERGFESVFSALGDVHDPRFPMTVYYAFRQTDISGEGAASTGWETALEALIRAGWLIDGTWPIRTEQAGGLRALGRNALASSVVVTCRRRLSDSGSTDRRGFVAVLEDELPDALRKLQQGQIAPVDLPQAAIGPGMAVFTRYSAVLEPDGTKMTVRSALARINEMLDRVLNEQEGDFDSTSRFAIAWYRQHGYRPGKFGDADNLARARNTSVELMKRDGILISRDNNVQLIAPSDLPWNYDVTADVRTSNWEALHHLIKTLERDGIAPAGDFLRDALARQDGAIDADLIKELAHLLFRIAESNGWVTDALSLNKLVTAWPEILEVATTEQSEPGSFQGSLTFEED
jgi:putative DNA methylase